MNCLINDENELMFGDEKIHKSCLEVLANISGT